MDYSKKATLKITLANLVFFALASVLSVAVGLLSTKLFPGNLLAQVGVTILVGLIVLFFMAVVLTRIVADPLKKLSDVIVYATHSSRSGAAPDTETLKIGRELVTSLALQIYDLASINEKKNEVTAENQEPTPQPTAQESSPSVEPNKILDHIGTPTIGIDAKQNITIVNRAACEYFGKEKEQIVGKPLFDAANMSFHNSDTFESWLKETQQKSAFSNKTWEKVRVDITDSEKSRLFDLVASYSKDEREGSTETMLTVYDRTEFYNRDSTEVGFVAMAVHELRTPLTVMHGYIEVFEDELGPKLDPEMANFMHKMKVSAQQLTEFVGNILNIARVEENQLVLELKQYRWAEIVNYAASDLQLRARVNDKRIMIQTDENLPNVAVDMVSIHEVINNLVDNAIKYSGKSERILITSKLNSDGLVEVGVQDFGIGAPRDVMDGLFQKFYRSHKSSAQVGGTGLGLYLCKAIVNAHGGNIWVRSKEGEGSTFSFTLMPYDKIKHEKSSGQDGIMRGAHGWIKNHTLNRQ